MRAASILLLLASQALAQNAPAPLPPAVYLSPASWALNLRESVDMALLTAPGQRGAPSAWPSEAISWVFVRGAGVQQNFDTLAPSMPRGNTARITPEASGGAMVGVEMSAELRTVAPAQLLEWARTASLEKQAMELGRLAPQAQQRVRIFRSAKALLRVNDGKPRAHAATLVGKAGQKAEIRPLFDPTMAARGDDVPLKLYIDGDKADGVTLVARSLADSKSVSIQSNASGLANLTITTEGVWQVDFSTLRKSARDDADWELFAGTLVFEVPSGKEIGR